MQIFHILYRCSQPGGMRGKSILHFPIYLTSSRQINLINLFEITESYKSKAHLFADQPPTFKIRCCCCFLKMNYHHHQSHLSVGCTHSYWKRFIMLDLRWIALDINISHETLLCSSAYLFFFSLPTAHTLTPTLCRD